MRVLLSSTGGFGHVLSMLPLALALRDAGHAVRWATDGPAVPHLRRQGIEVVLAGPDADGVAALHRELAAELAREPIDRRAAIAFPRLFGARVAPAMLPDLESVAQAWGPELLVHEQAELAAPLVGARLGVRTVTHAFGGAVPAPILAAAGDAVAGLWRAAGLDVPRFAGCFTGGYVDLFPASLSTVSTAHIPVPVLMRPTAVRPGEPERDAPLLLLTLGTVHKVVPVLTAALAGLAAVRPTPRIVASVGPGIDPEALGPQPQHVRLERWVDQDDVIPRCRAVVSHAGSGTVLGAMAAGVPMLCLPQGADQFRNAAAVVAAGAGLSLTPGDATPAAIRSAVERLLSEDRFAAAARSIGREIATMPGPDEVVRRLAHPAPDGSPALA